MKMKWKKFNEKINRGEITWWQMKLPSGKVDFGREKALMLGYEPDNFTNYKHFTDLLHSEDYEKAMKAMREHLDGKKKYYETSYRIKTKSGKYIRFADIGKIVSKKNKSISVIGFVFKINNKEDIKYYTNLVKKGGLSFSEIILKIIK